MTEPDGWLDKVQKLLAMAESTNNPHEAEAFSARAEELMVKYSITEAQLQASGKHVQEKVVSVRIQLPDPYATVKRDLTTSVARALGCRAIYQAMTAWRGDRRGKVHFMTIVGFASDVDKAQTLLASLFIQMSRAVVNARPEQEWWRGEYNASKTRTFRHAVCVGFTHIVANRLRQLRAAAEKEANNETPGTDLVLVDRTKRVEDEYDVMFPERSQLKPASARSQAGYNRGVAAGMVADLNQPRMGQTNRVGIQN